MTVDRILVWGIGMCILQIVALVTKDKNAAIKGDYPVISKDEVHHYEWDTIVIAALGEE